MKRTTKIAAILMVCLLCVFALASCFEKSAFELYDAALEKITKADGYELTGTMKTTTSFSGMDIAQTSQVAIKKNGDNFYTKMSMPEIMDVEMTYIDGVAYMATTDGEDALKYKVAVSKDKLGELELQLSTEIDFPALTDDMLKDTEVTVKDGISTFSATIDGAKIKELMLSTLEESLASFLTPNEDGSFDSSAVTIADVAISASIDKNDNFTAFSMNLPITITVDGETLSMGLEISYVFTNPGTVPAIAAPSDADTYEEVSLDDLTAEDDFDFDFDDFD